jgi:hypothetical protein
MSRISTRELRVIRDAQRSLQRSTTCSRCEKPTVELTLVGHGPVGLRVFEAETADSYCTCPPGYELTAEGRRAIEHPYEPDARD